MPCEECARLEKIRYDCIVRYVELVQARNRIESETGIATPALNQTIPAAEAQLDRAWAALDAHRRTLHKADHANA